VFANPVHFDEKPAARIRDRESIGRRGDAIDAYRDRKVAIKRGLKLPDLRNGKVTLSTLIDDALEYQENRASRIRDYESNRRSSKKRWEAGALRRSRHKKLTLG
jgi:hypothetical protein